MTKSELLGADILSIRDLSKDNLLTILDVAGELEKSPKHELLKGKVVATLFFEPSTRTRLSFCSAVEKMAGQVLGFENDTVTSVTKGETIWDTIKMVDQYADAIVIRHKIEGAARVAAEASSKPVVNAGDGANQHPTQTLLDLYTIKKEMGKLDDLNVGFVGDLKYGRTVHSLSTALGHFNTKQFFIAPEELKMPQSYLEDLDKKGREYVEQEDLMDVIGDLDIIYMTRIQKERFPDPVEYSRLKGVYQIDKSILKVSKPDMRILHPLPRVDEINTDLDDSPNAAYFRQAGNGVVVRQAILGLTLGVIK